jgi:hypothetical protein
MDTWYILVYFPSFGMLREEKSGNPGLISQQTKESAIRRLRNNCRFN